MTIEAKIPNWLSCRVLNLTDYDTTLLEEWAIATYVGHVPLVFRYFSPSTEHHTYMKSNHGVPMYVKFLRNGDTRWKADKDTPFEVRVVPPHLLKDAASPMEYFALTEGLAPSCLSAQIIWRLASIGYNARRAKSAHVDIPSPSCRWRVDGHIERLPRIGDRLPGLRFGAEPVNVEAREAEYANREKLRKVLRDTENGQERVEFLSRRMKEYTDAMLHTEKEREQAEQQNELRRQEIAALCEKLNVTLPTRQFPWLETKRAEDVSGLFNQMYLKNQVTTIDN